MICEADGAYEEGHEVESDHDDEQNKASYPA
jgi:hypothetical protein